MDQPPKVKRQRSENWLEKDKIILKNLIRERVRVIENKNTNSKSNSAKISAWREIQERFINKCQGAQRTMTQLKAQWGILKMLTNKLKAAERKELIKTGGEPSLPIEDGSSEDIGSWLPQEFTVDTNEFDSDRTIQICHTKDKTMPAEKLVEFEIECRKELLTIQMTNETVRHQNLQLKGILMKEKIKYYQNNNKL